MRMKREKVIRALIEQVFDNDDMDSFITDILREGCRGYDNMTNKELEQVYNEGAWEGEEVTVID